MRKKSVVLICILILMAVTTYLIYDLIKEEPINQEDITNNENNIEEINSMINIQIGDRTLTATLVNNSSTQALLELLSHGPVTINMRDYAGMEKVGALPQSLPRNDEPMTAKAGDLILYLGNAFVIYYDNNSWDFTKLGTINDITTTELRSILGSGSIIATLSLTE